MLLLLVLAGWSPHGLVGIETGPRKRNFSSHRSNTYLHQHLNMEKEKKEKKISIHVVVAM
jgi:hypothetical protein